MYEAKEQLSESKGKRLHDLAIKQYRASESTLAEHKDKAEECAKFALLGEQWDESVKNARAQEGRPCLTINTLPAFVHQIVNDARQSKPAINVSPVDGGADKDTAKVIRSIIRHIERSSQADIAYDTAIESAAVNGFGFFRLGMEYAHHDSFDIEARILAVDDPMRVFWDVNSARYDAADWQYCFFLDDLDKAEFERKYPKHDACSFEYEDEADRADEFPSVRVAEYWRREVKTRKLLRADVMGQIVTIREEDLVKKFEAGEIDPAVVQILAERDAEYGEVKRFILSGADVLEEDVWPGSMIPVSPVWGNRVTIGGKKHYLNFIRDLMDPQRQFNYHRSASAELLALAPKTPFLVAKGAILPEDRRKWETANTRSHAFLEFDSSLGHAPQRQPYAGAPTGNVNEAMMAKDDIKAISGVHDASLGKDGNETSGRAIQARQAQSSTGNYHYIDNRNRAIAYAGRCLVEIIPTLYSQREAVRILGEDGAESVINLKSDTRVNDDGEPAIYDLSTGTYDVSVTAGPSTGTERQEAADMMIQVMERVPGAAQYMADLLFENMDVPGADKLAERAKQVMQMLAGPAMGGGMPQPGQPGQPQPPLQGGAPIPQQPMAF